MQIDKKRGGLFSPPLVMLKLSRQCLEYYLHFVEHAED